MTDSTRPNPNAVQLTSADVAASIAFYRDLCGFTLAEQWPDKNPMWARLDLHGQSIMVGVAGNPEQIAQMCQDDPEEAAWHTSAYEEIQANQAGAGVFLYFAVDNADEFHQQVQKRGGETATNPKTQFYGLRDFGMRDPDGYRLVFYHTVIMESCQSCSMPLPNAKEGDMYCEHCQDDQGQLKPFEEIVAGSAAYLSQSQGIPLEEATAAAREHLKKMPAWVCADPS